MPPVDAAEVTVTALPPAVYPPAVASSDTDAALVAVATLGAVFDKMIE
jgi:hypothetical protein